MGTSLVLPEVSIRTGALCWGRLGPLHPPLEPRVCSWFTVLDDFCHSPVESEEAESTSQAYEHCWGNTLEKTVPPFMAPEHRNGSRWGLLV